MEDLNSNNFIISRGFITMLYKKVTAYTKKSHDIQLFAIQYKKGIAALMYVMCLCYSFNAVPVLPPAT
nr:MAG TPA: hypothetical protein [Caudoviricetes sp.]